MTIWQFICTQQFGMVYSMMESSESWQERCKRLYTARGLTQEGFAELVGVSQSGMSKWLGGLREPSMADFAKMAEVLTNAGELVSPAYLMWGDPSPTEVVEQVRRVLLPRRDDNQPLALPSPAND